MSLSRVRFALTLSALLFAPARALAQPAPEPPTADDGAKAPDRAADPPILPPEGAPAEPPVAPAASAEDEERAARERARIEALERRVAEDGKRIEKLESRVAFLKHLRIESFIQPQLLVQTYNTAASPNLQANGELPTGIGANDTIAKLDGTTTNGTFFRVRRARMRTFYETDVMKMFLQIDVLPAGGIGPGIGTILRNAEASGIVRWTRDVRTELTAGLFFTPFRAELLEASVNRPFIERTWFVQNVFPIERDYGVKARTIALDGDRLVVELAAVNGQRLGERTFVALPDLNRSKDFIAYTTYRLGFVTLGASGYLGRGQIVDAQALRFKQYSRWAANAQVSAAHRLLGVGESRLSSELTFARNMDSGVIYPYAVPTIPANITDAVADLDQRALYVRAEQDIGRHATLGYRYDMYTPNTAIKNNARDTHAFLAVWKISPNLRFMSELGWAIDNVHPTGAPAPSKHIVYFSNVLQAMF
ncbi:MAG: hypothetical protein KF795_25255 [Labilithrix sp.]|nr:hypothetical protein [Labilithrix sp.]